MTLNLHNYNSAILSDISLSLKQGENLLILGENGVGKSTLAKVLCGIEASQSVFLDEQSLHSLKGKERREYLNYIPPKLEIFDAFLSVKDFLALSNRKNIYSIEEVAQKVGISHLFYQPCQNLSSGEAQLLMVASSLLHSANFTIFDEPTANLDPQKIQILFGLFKDISLLKSKIIISHNLDFAYQLGFDILFLQDKKIAFYGSSQDFFSQNNLDSFYQGSVIKIQNNIVVKL